MRPPKKHMKAFFRGFSTLEILLAGAVFSVFSWGVIETTLGVLEMDRLGQETTVATEYAVEGLEAVRAIKEENFDALVPTNATGIAEQDGFLVFDGTENVFDGTYTRTIVIETGKRDENGNITESDGTEDSDTMRVRVTVAWQLSPTRNDSVVLETYFTRWHP